MVPGSITKTLTNGLCQQVFGASSSGIFSRCLGHHPTEKGIQLLEKVQGECLRRILGAKKHSSTEALNVIANVLPIRVRIQELCSVHT